jgi:hypothetical protein
LKSTAAADDPAQLFSVNSIRRFGREVSGRVVIVRSS